MTLSSKTPKKTARSRPPSTSDGLAEISFDSWLDFKGNFRRKLEDVTASFGGTHTAGSKVRKYIFRGHGCAHWSLEAPFDRWMKQANVGEDKIEEHYGQLLEVFVKTGSEMGALPKDFEPLCEIDYARWDTLPANEAGRSISVRLQAYAQHHGLQTRLLDWTRSPYVAAFFAFSEWRRCESDKVAIWCMDTVGTQKWFRSNEIVILDSQDSLNARQIWQRGAFTVNRSHILQMDKLFMKSHGRFSGSIDCPLLFKCTIPITEKTEALEDLELMRVNFQSVFPDIDGSVKYATALIETVLQSER
jgi:FRG domain